MVDEVKSPLLEDVLAIVSHDLRTPLSVVHTTASMLLNPKYQLTPQQVREQHERIRRNAELLNRMISDLMDMAALRAGKLSIEPRAVDLEGLLREVVAAQEAPARDKGVTLSYDGAGSLNAAADRARLTQLFQKLICHALEASEAGGRITISSHGNGNHAHIEISDTGRGISAEELPQIFAPYSPTAERLQKSGASLGLYIARGIVEAHGGQIRCLSEPGAGTIFSVTLPLAQ